MPRLVLRVACRAAGVALFRGFACTAHDAVSGGVSRGAAALVRTQSALLTERFTIGRLHGQRPAPCGRTASLPFARCPAPLRPGTDAFARYARAARVVREASRATTNDTEPATLHALALVDLRAADDSGATLDRVAAMLERARARVPNDPALLNDLAVAYLELGTRDRQLEPLLRALDAVDRAVQQQPTVPAARFNRALILEQLRLVARAQAAWSAVLAAEPEAGWRSEAGVHLRALARGSDTLSARDYPQRARDAAFQLLGAWGQATLDGDRTRADRLLAAGRAAGDSVARLGADRSIAHAIRWVGSVAARRPRASAIARTLVGFSRGVRLVDAGQYDEAAPALRAAEAHLRSLGSPLAGWAAAYRATAEMNQRHYDRADRRLRRLVAEASAHEPALRGWALWLRGTIAFRRGEFEAATERYAAARPYFAAARDAKHEAAVSFVLADGLALSGRVADSHAEAYLGLHALSTYRQYVTLHGHLLRVAAVARAAGLRHAERDFVDEVVALNSAGRRPDVLVAALGTRARTLASLGDSAAAFADLDSAGRVAERLTGTNRRLAVASATLIRGQLLRTRDAPAALALLTRAADDYRQLGVWSYASAALSALALVARDAGQVDVARARLVESVALLDRPVGSFTSVESRSAFDETVERVYDAIIDLEVSAGRPAVAYEYLERERAGVWAGMRGRPEPGACESACALAAVARAVPAGVLFASYAVLPDRLVVWFASSHGTGYRVVPVPRDSLAALVGQFGREASGTGPAQLATRARLHVLLLAPLADQLHGVHTLAIVPDRELARLPFAALWNPGTRRYAIAEYAIRTLPSAAFARAAWTAPRSPTRRGSGHASSALVVGDPVLDPVTAARLQPLPGANREARAVAQLYPHARVVTGTGASRATVVHALARYPVVHFAGHAVFDEARPERSYLALAADAAGRPGRLEAREIAAMRLSHLAVVVLSACHTLNARPTRTGAVAGLATSFLRAGAPATVSTLWDVRDDVVADVMVDFHRATQGGVDAAVALQRAQLAALASPRAAHRAPAVWAAFVYSGP